LLYYLIANAAAYTQISEQRRFPRGLQIIGIAGCGILVLTLPLRAVLAGTLVIAVGVIFRAIRIRVQRLRTGVDTGEH
jgi:APA family basic amino acid/polyamine antiporter